jgi:predicted DNA-binding transcriptional regulator AlpA
MSTPQPTSQSASISIPSGSLVPARKVQERYGISGRTLDRWLAQPDLRFPKPILINRRRYFRESELSEFEHSHASRP